MAEQAGYSGTPLARKLGIGEDDEVVVVGAPNGLTDRLAAEVGDEAVIHTDLTDAALLRRHRRLRHLAGRTGEPA